jgi:hypothetical protein
MRNEEAFYVFSLSGARKRWIVGSFLKNEISRTGRFGTVGRKMKKIAGIVSYLRPVK